MKHLIVIVGGTAAALALAACGSGTAATSSSSTTSTSRPAGTGPGGVARRGAAGELAQINGTSLILNTTAGDVTVGYTTTTTITQTKTGVLADIVPGSCVVITGQKDATGTLVASSVRLSQPVNGACAAGLGNGAPGAGTGTRPNPGGTPRATPAPGQPVPAFAAGSVTAVNGTAVTVQPTTGAAQAVTVPTTVTVSESSAASPTDLTVGDCIQATGAKDSSGTVAATSLSIVPAGPSGCFTGGGAGGFGGRGFGGGGSGGQAPVG